MKTTTYKNTKISFTDQGNGKAVVLLHGFLENQKMWNDFIPEFSKKNRVITIDLLGHEILNLWDIYIQWKIKQIWFIMFYTN